MKFLLALAVVSLSAPADALDRQAAVVQYTAKSWTEQGGLAPGNVWAIAQDREGYLWLGTTGGLVRFDGLHFTDWKIDGRGESSDDEIISLLAGRDGTLWVGFGGAGGVARLRDGRLVANYPPTDGPPDGRLMALLEDREGTIWAGGKGGLSRFRSGRWERMGRSEGFASPGVMALLEDPRGNLWIGTSVGVFVRRPGNDTFQRRAFPSHRVWSIAGDQDDTLWITDPQRAFERLDEADRPAEGPGRSAVAAVGYHLLRDRRGNLWVATVGQGLLLIPAHRAGAPVTVKRFTTQDGLAGDLVWTLFEDADGNIWVGTQAGLTRVSRSGVSSLLSLDQGMRVVRVIAATRDKSIWAGTSGGLVRFANGETKWYAAPDGLTDLDVTALHEDEKGTLWVATFQSVFRFTQGRFVRVPLSGDVRPNGIRGITTDADGVLWLCDGEKGLFRLNGGRLTGSDDAGARQGVAASALTTRNGDVWVGYRDGGTAVYRRGALHRSYSVKDGLARGGVTAMFEDQGGSVWVATTSGLSRFKDGRLTTLRQKGRLPGISLTTIVDDEKGFIWLGVGTGLVRLSPAEFERGAANQSHVLQYELYDEEDGLHLGARTWFGYQPTAARAADGTLWFVTANGVSTVKVNRLLADDTPPRVKIEAAAANEGRFEPVSQARLAARTSRLEIEYSALRLTGSAKVRFRYRLDGFDEEWVDAGVSRSAFYTNLPPGRYRFRVTAAGRDGVWNPADASWSFSIAPTFYQTGWFLAVCASAVGALFAMAWQLRVRKSRKQLALVLAERARMARELHDTLLQSLAGLELQVDVISSQADTSPGLVKPQLERVRRQIQRDLCEARQSILGLRSPLLDGDLATALRRVGEDLTQQNGVRFEFAVNGSPSVATGRVEEQLTRIGQEAVSNAVRHAHPNLVRMELCYEPDSVRLRVSDDGCGIDLDQMARSSWHHWGLAIMEERAQQIGGHVRVASHPGGGTDVETIVPLLAER